MARYQAQITHPDFERRMWLGILVEVEATDPHDAFIRGREKIEQEFDIMTLYRHEVSITDCDEDE